MKTCNHKIDETNLISTENIEKNTLTFTTKCVKCGKLISVELSVNAFMSEGAFRLGVIGELNKKAKELSEKKE